MDTEIVATYRFRHQAEIAQQLLAANDIASIVAADDAGGWQPWIMADVRLIVRAEDVSRARDVLADHEADDT